MKDTRFIELLNLHVDHQLTPPEARELDAELRANPSRHRTYLQYCRMQKACAMLFEVERARAPASPRLARALANANRKISAAPSRASAHRWWRGSFAFGGLVAAVACAAVVFVVMKTPRQPEAARAGFAVAQVDAPAPVALAVAPQPASAPDSVITLQPVPRQKYFRLPTITGFASEQTPLPQALANESLFVWTKDFQLRPLRKVSIEDAIAGLRRFEKPQAGASLLRLPAIGSGDEPAEEMTAIEFKK